MALQMQNSILYTRPSVTISMTSTLHNCCTWMLYPNTNTCSTWTTPHNCATVSYCSVNQLMQHSADSSSVTKLVLPLQTQFILRD